MPKLAELQLPQLPALPALHLPRLPELRLRPGRRLGSGGADLQNDGFVTSDLVQDLTSGSEEWRLQIERQGVRVWRRAVPGSPYDEIRGNGLIKVPPKVVLALLKVADEEVVRQYNPLYGSGYDLQQIDGSTKVSYASVRAVFPFKPRDTVTRIAFRELPGKGGTAVLQRAVTHSAMPTRPGYVRAEILRGMFLVQPVKRRPGVTNFTFTQQVNVGGIIPPWLMNQLVAQDAIQLLKRISKTSRRRAAAERGGRDKLEEESAVEAL